LRLGHTKTSTCETGLERPGQIVSPSTAATVRITVVRITIVITAVVTVGVGNDAKVVTDLVPLVFCVTVDSGTIKLIVDLRRNVENPTCFIFAAA